VEVNLTRCEDKSSMCGLELHEVEVTESIAGVFGVELDCTRLRTRVLRSRLLRARQGVHEFLRRRTVRGAVLEIVLGYLTFMHSVNRGSLNIFHTCYRFIHAHCDSAAPLWKSVREELFGFASLSALLVSDWDRHWRGMVFSVDAWETGFGVTKVQWPVADVEQVASVPGRARFRKTCVVGARTDRQ
jgi:hypothetical protein